MSYRIHEPAESDGLWTDNRGRVEYAVESLAKLAAEVVREGSSGTIGVEIPFKDGRLGRVKEIRIVYQSK